MVLEVLDVVAKLTGAFAAIVVVIIASTYERRMNMASMVSQREQAESQMRADMFSNLIGPIVGGDKAADILPDRERLLVELLALNFHEHFEIKPLMLRVDAALAAHPKGLTAEEANKSRKSLRSVARRVSDEELAQLIGEAGTKASPTDFWAPSRSAACTVFIISTGPDLPSPPEDSATARGCERAIPFKYPAMLTSPDGRYSFTMIIVDADWQDQTLRLQVNLMTNAPANEARYEDISSEFTLTWYDFPLTDNTLLPDGNRFAVILANFDPDRHLAKVKLIWFPRNFFTPRERPMDRASYLELLGKVDN